MFNFLRYLFLQSIFHSYRDDEVIAWRLTGMAARGSMELGLHRQESWQKAGGAFPGALEWMWASRLFWCIYVLDRKWSFGTGLHLQYRIATWIPIYRSPVILLLT